MAPLTFSIAIGQPAKSWQDQASAADRVCA